MTALMPRETTTSPRIPDLKSSCPPALITSRPTYVYPGQIVVATDARPRMVILACGVAVTLWDPWIELGGMTHFLLPTWKGSGQPPVASRFGDIALSNLVAKMETEGATPERMTARLFGGATVGSAIPSLDLGAANVRAAELRLEEIGVQTITADVGGRFSRKLNWNPATGTSTVEIL